MNCVFATSLGNSYQVFGAADPWYMNFPAINGTLDSDLNFRVDSIESDCVITNTTNLLNEMVIYDYVCRNDFKPSSTSNVGALYAWAAGIPYIDFGSNTAQYMKPNMIGATPFNSEIFTQYFKVVKVHKVRLGPGATHTHYHSAHLHRDMYVSRFRMSTDSVEGLTCGSIYVIKGQPVEATSGSAGSITTGIVDVDVMFKYKAIILKAITNTSIVNKLNVATTYYSATNSIGIFKAVTDTSSVYTAETLS